jgi:hypothetical protein
MSLLDGIVGIRAIFQSGIEMISRKALDFTGDFVLADNPTTGRTEVSVAASPGIVWQGEWDEATTYVARDTVSHAGDVWFAAAGAAAGAEPGEADAWVLLLSGTGLSEDALAALAGTEGAPSDTNRFVTDEDTRLPSTDQTEALAGTSGTAPSVANKFVDAADRKLRRGLILLESALASDVSTNNTANPPTVVLHSDTLNLDEDEDVYVRFDVAVSPSTGMSWRLQCFVDGVFVRGCNQSAYAASAVSQASFGALLSLSAGAHTIEMKWSVVSGTITCNPVAGRSCHAVITVWSA